MAIVGAGALGSFFSSRLSQVVPTALIGRGARDVPEADWVIVLVKAYDTAAALRTASRMKAKGVVSLQNGLIEAVPQGVTTAAAYRDGKRVVPVATGKTLLPPGFAMLSSYLRRAGFDARVVGNIQNARLRCRCTDTPGLLPAHPRHGSRLESSTARPAATLSDRRNRPTMRRPFRYTFFALMAALFAAAGASVIAQDWRNASREPVGLAPHPGLVKEAIVQVYGARAVGAKGLFGVHTWVAVKPTDAPSWTVYEVIGWRLRWSDSAVVVRSRDPDARWFGAEPELYAEKRGPGVDALIQRIDKAARAYPYAGEYTVWPGPNSNTFTSWIARAVPELEIDLPATAIGKDYLGSSLFGSAPSGSGFQVSLAGLLGIAASGVDGLEINLLGLNFGVSPNGLKLPMIGIIGGFTPRAGAVGQAAQAAVVPLQD